MKLTGSYALKVAIIYAAAGALWLFFSDAALQRIFPDTAVLAVFQSYKGWLFVLASAILVFWLSWRALEEQAGLIRQLRQSAVVFERTHDGVIISDHRNRVVSVNPAFQTQTGRSEAMLRGADLAGLHSSRHDASFLARLTDQIARQGYWNGEIAMRTADGGERPFLATATRIGSDRDGNDRYAWIFTDIGDLKRAQRRLEDLAYYDSLTGLPNRLFLNEKLSHLLAGAGAEEREIAVLYVDLDHFRNVNDSFGHPVGDDLLVMVARRLRSGLPEDAGLAHLGGDEFVIYLENINDGSQVSECAANMLGAIAEPFRLANQSEVYVSASIGICVFPRDAKSVTELLQYANAAMYQAKKTGRNTWQFYSAGLVRSASRRLQLDAQLRHALNAGEFVLHYQPIVAGTTEYHVNGVEALIRWQTPEGRMVLPADFISSAEETGLIVPLGDWVLTEACRQAAEWQHKTGPLPVAVNLSARQFQSGRLAQGIERALEQSGLAPELLHLEITESMLMEQIETGQDLLRRLRAMGVGVSLDDFGTGYSSLAYLKKLDLDTLKIDRSFVHDLADNSSDRDLISAVISMAHCLHLKVVAEGVDSLGQLDILTSLGCDYFQGYFFSHPVAADKVVDIVSALEKVKGEARSPGQ